VAAEAEAEQAYRAATARFAELGRALASRLIGEVGIPAGGIAIDREGEHGLSEAARFHFTSRMSYHYPAAPWATWLVDTLLPRGLARARMHAAAERYLRDLLSVNAERFKNDLDQRVLESRRGLERRLKRSLDEILGLALDSLERARESRARGREAVAADVARIDAVLAELETVGAADCVTGDRIE
jgi:hypothetical protein